MARKSERRRDRLRRAILDILNDPVLIAFARDEKDPKEISTWLRSRGIRISVWQVRKRIRNFSLGRTATK